MNFDDFKNKYCSQTPQITKLNLNIQGWNSESIALKESILENNPQTILEVGSWLGASAIFMSSLTNAQIICVDTFLGSNEVLWRDGRTTDLLSNFNALYNQFCANITHSNLNNQISPLPMTSSSAAELLAKENVSVDMVYIDAGHREREVYADLQDWWPLTNKVLVGDDYSPSWPGVMAAADRFAVENNLQIKILDSKFIFIR
jgi:cephalosporin hydroxylase